MIDIRKFIQSLGDAAPAYFDVKPETISRWTKTGNVPIKVAQKIFAAAEAISNSQAAPINVPQVNLPAQAGVDPMTHLPTNIDKTLPNIAPMGGQGLPAVIETNPVEQSFGNNFTRPGRAAPRPPMKLREEGGQKVAFVENTPPLAEQKNADGSARVILPPSIPQGAGWAAPNEQPATPAPESVSTEKV